MEYRFSKNRPEIVKSLASRLSAGCTLSIWQKESDGSRSILEKMIFHELFPDEGVFTLRTSTELPFKIDATKDVYFLLEEHDFIFKTKMAVDQKDFLTLQIPKEVRLKEFRVHERQYFTLEEKKFADVVFVEKKSKDKISVSCPVLNISEGGASILVTKESFSNIDFSADVLFKMTNAFQIAIIRNARVFSKKGLRTDEFYAIGVEFQ
jgi:hypothetical protein